MTVKNTLVSLCVAGFLQVSALSPAAASLIVTFDFAGVIDELSLDNGLFGPPGSVNVGDTFTGHFAYEIGPGNPDQFPGDPLQGGYNLLEFVIDGSVATTSTLIGGIDIEEPGLAIPPAPPAPGSEAFVILGISPQYQGPVGLRLEAPYGTVFPNDSLPTDLNLADFTNGALVVGSGGAAIPPAQPSGDDVGLITSLTRRNIVAVPVPLSMSLFLFGLVFLTAIRHRSRLSLRASR